MTDEQLTYIKQRLDAIEARVNALPTSQGMGCVFELVIIFLLVILLGKLP